MKIFNARGVGSKRLLLAASLSVICLSPANAGSYTYEVNVFNALTGFITTNCDTCVLNSSDITAWSFTSKATGPLAVDGQPVTATSFASGAQLTGSGMVATPTAITFAFGSAANDLMFFVTNNAKIEFADLASSLGSLSLLGLPIGEVDACTRSFAPGAAIDNCGGATVAGTRTIATLKKVAAPEIDPASLAGSMTLLIGALAVITSRRGYTQPCGCRGQAPLRGQITLAGESSASAIHSMLSTCEAARMPAAA
jgi:hypothetical protein